MTVGYETGISDVPGFKWQSRSVTGIADGAAAAFTFGGGSFGYDCPDDIPNYDNFGRQFGLSASRMVRVRQKHTDNVQIVLKDNAGDGVIREGRSGFCDAMITDVPGIMLCVVTADCVPVFLFDPVRRAVGMAHSGWAGTAAQIAAKAAVKMRDAYDSDPRDLIAALGPYNCGKCYEVDEPVKKEFAKSFSPAELESFLVPRIPADSGKYLLDMGAAIKLSLQKTGVSLSNIHDGGLCTFHTPELPSWRRDHKKGYHILSGIVLNR